MSTETVQSENSCLIEVADSAFGRQESELFRISEILADAVFAPPWQLSNWKLGKANDEATAAGSVTSYIRFLHSQGADYTLYRDTKKRGIDSIVGFGISGLFTEESLHGVGVANGLQREDLEVALPGETPYPQIGDYYIAVWAIQGKSGVNNKPLECHRSKTLNGKFAFRWMAEMQMQLGLKSGAKRIWVRTHKDQPKVTHICTSLGFKAIGAPIEQHCGDQIAPRTVMVAKAAEVPQITDSTVIHG